MTEQQHTNNDALDRIASALERLADVADETKAIQERPFDYRIVRSWRFQTKNSQYL